MLLRKNILYFMLAATFLPSAVAAASASDILPDKPLFNDSVSAKSKTDNFIIPSNGIIAMNVDGKVHLFTGNGRFLIHGTLFDTWSRKELESMADLKKYSTIIPFKELKLDFSDLQPAVWGTGSEKAIIFSDPYCSYCETVLKQITDLDPKKYTVYVLSVGALGEKSVQRNLELYCAADRLAADKAIIEHDNKLKFKQQDNCDMEPLGRRLVTAQVFGISMVPFIIRDDGKYSVGLPDQGLKNFLAGK